MLLMLRWFNSELWLGSQYASKELVHTVFCPTTKSVFLVVRSVHTGGQVDKPAIILSSWLNSCLSELSPWTGYLFLETDNLQHSLLIWQTLCLRYTEVFTIWRQLSSPIQHVACQIDLPKMWIIMQWPWSCRQTAGKEWPSAEPTPLLSVCVCVCACALCALFTNSRCGGRLGHYKSQFSEYVLHLQCHCHCWETVWVKASVHIDDFKIAGKTICIAKHHQGQVRSFFFLWL